ncbi:MAG TPA: glycosyltransferase family 1 protein [Gemmatimonadales bacterium]|nr:glycosyltransferase family 1 protein [Gemmatimonadales bacterium]
MSDRQVAFDTTVARLGVAGPHVYVAELAQALRPLLGDRFRPIATSLARLPTGGRRAGDRLRTLGRDLWWHQIGVTRAARRAGASLLHLPAGVGPIQPRMSTVVTIHDLAVLAFPEFFPRWFRHYARVVLPRLARAADAILTGSQAAKADIVHTLGVPEHRVAVVPNGVDPAFAPLPEGSERDQEVLRRFGLPRDFVLTVGSREPRKNLPRLLEALRLLRSRAGMDDVTLVHAGPEGWLADDLPAMVRRLGLTDAVRFLGYVSREDLVVLYGMARLLAYPSLYEGFGLPVVEAMACGCPVLTSNVSALPEVTGDAGWLVDPGSVEEIAEGIAALWSDAELRRTLAARGRARARCFSWERTARETAAVYDRVLP